MQKHRKLNWNLRRITKTQLFIVIIITDDEGRKEDMIHGHKLVIGCYWRVLPEVEGWDDAKRKLWANIYLMTEHDSLVLKDSDFEHLVKDHQRSELICLYLD